MWSSRLFWKLFLAYAGLVVVAAVCFVLIVSGWLEAQIRQQVQERLYDTAVVVRSHVADHWQRGRSDELQSFEVPADL